MTTAHLSADEARRRLVHHLGLDGSWDLEGAEGVRSLLRRLGMIQLDPLDPLGTNADLVALARVRDIGRGDVHRHTRGASFEHFAKQRCLLPARGFPWYRDHASAVGWWRTDDRLARVTPDVLDAVEREVADRGPLALSELTGRGTVDPLDWNGWKGTGKATTLALEVLWTDCRVVVVGRTGTNERIYDIPSRALPEVAAVGSGPWASWALPERVRAAGLLPTVTGPWWGALSAARSDGSIDAAIARGEAIPVRVDGLRRDFLAPPGFLEARPPEPDDTLRLLGPLDPLLWDRRLVQHAFGFDYVWEVYKPAAKRTWGWYVVPLLRAGRLIGRLEGRHDRGSGTLRIENVWWESAAVRDAAALRRALERHAAALGATSLQVRRGAHRTAG